MAVLRGVHFNIYSGIAQQFGRVFILRSAKIGMQFVHMLPHCRIVPLFVTSTAVFQKNLTVLEHIRKYQLRLSHQLAFHLWSAPSSNSLPVIVKSSREISQTLTIFSSPVEMIKFGCLFVSHIFMLTQKQFSGSSVGTGANTHQSSQTNSSCTFSAMNPKVNMSIVLYPGRQCSAKWHINTLLWHEHVPCMMPNN